jgi:hypothetical protein
MNLMAIPADKTVEVITLWNFKGKITAAAITAIFHFVPI